MLFTLIANTAILSLASLEWKPCPVWSPEGLGLLNSSALSCTPPNPSTTSAWCTTLRVPLDYEKPNGVMIDYFVKRVTSDLQNSNGQVWLINGGPGNSGVEMECMLSEAIGLTQGLVDYIIPDHRGTGRSSALFCNFEEKTTNSSVTCVTEAVRHYGMGYLSQFSASNAARDINFGITAIAQRNSSYKVTVHGVSYGTYLIQHFLQLFPDGADAILLDGVCAPDLIRTAWASPIINTAAGAFAAVCAADDVCANKMGAPVSPFFRLQLVFEQLNAGVLECNKQLPEPITVSWLQSLFGRWIRSMAPTRTRLLIFPVVNRILRCNSDDITVLKFLLSNNKYLDQQNNFGGLGLNLQHLNSNANANTTFITNDLVAFIIGSSEFNQFKNNLVSEDQLEQIHRALLVTNAADASLYSLLKADGFIPYQDPLSHKYPKTNVNLLMVVGSLDPQTVPEWAWHAMHFYPKTNQQLVVIPYAVHAVSSLPGLSPVVTGGPDCAFQVAASFYISAGEQVNTSCLSMMEKPDVAGTRNETSAISLAFLGTQDLWG